MTMLALGIEAVERGMIPDALTRRAVRRLCARRLSERPGDGDNHHCDDRRQFVESLRRGPIAPVPEMANEQHYEVAPDFFAAVLGPRLKYSCCYWPSGVTSLAEAEEQALRVTCDRAGLVDGQDILELGCGWGALSLWMAEHYPRSRITAMSNSTAQRRHIATMAAERGLLNLRVLTADINEFAPPVGVSRDDRFDRIVSLEMFEHLRNYELLLERIASWLRDDGRLFVHIFCHRDWAYSFETTGTANWMGRYFFTGGIMPSFDLLKQFERQMTVCDDWHWNGSHYQRTAEAWLSNLDSHQPRVLDSLAMTYGPAHAKRWLHRWRMFFLAVAELFGYAEGREWYVGHYLLRPTQRTS